MELTRFEPVTGAARVPETLRVLPIPDLLIAAAAEIEQLTVLHYDSDFEIIAKLTGQRCEWVVPRGSID